MNSVYSPSTGGYVARVGPPWIETLARVTLCTSRSGRVENFIWNANLRPTQTASASSAIHKLMAECILLSASIFFASSLLLAFNIGLEKWLPLLRFSGRFPLDCKFSNVRRYLQFE